jgi:hypothetical protein
MHLRVDPSTKNWIKDLASINFAGQTIGHHDNADSSQINTGSWRAVAQPSTEQRRTLAPSRPSSAQLDLGLQD